MKPLQTENQTKEIEMAFNLTNTVRTSSRKSDGKTNSGVASLDRPNAPKGFAHIFKVGSSETTDPAIKAFKGNSGYATRIGSTKPW